MDGPGAGKHIQAGAKKVIITAPAKGADIPTYVVGVNEQDYSHEIANIIRSVTIATKSVLCVCVDATLFLCQLIDYSYSIPHKWLHCCFFNVQQRFLHHKLSCSLCEDPG